MARFKAVLQQKNCGDDQRIVERFRIFCFKHDLEALILAAEEALKRRIGVLKFSTSWYIPVEDQNHGNPPKRIVEKLFHENGKHYRDTIDAPLILGESDYLTLMQLCPQCFKPFVDFLVSL